MEIIKLLQYCTLNQQVFNYFIYDSFYNKNVLDFVAFFAQLSSIRPINSPRVINAYCCNKIGYTSIVIGNKKCVSCEDVPIIRFVQSQFRVRVRVTIACLKVMKSCALLLIIKLIVFFQVLVILNVFLKNVPSQAK